MDKATIGVGVVIGAALSKGYFRTMETAEQKSMRLGKQWQETTKKLTATRDVIKYKSVLDKLQAKQAALGYNSERLQQGIDEVTIRYRQAKSATKSYGVSVGDAVRQHQRLNKELRRTEKQQAALIKKQEASSKLSSMRMKMLGIVGAGYGVGQMVGSAMSLEEQGLYLKTVINAKDGDQAAAVSRARSSAREFARNSLASEQEVLNIEYALNSAGLDEEVARAGTKLVHKLAKVTKGLPDQVGEIFGVTFNNMGAAMQGTADEKMTRIGNILAKTQFKFQIRDFTQLGESLKYAAASAAGAKMSLEQTATVIGQLNSAGLQGSMAGTAFSGVLRNLTKASDEIGFEVVRDEKGELDLITTLENLNSEIESLDTDERSDLIQKIFGDEGKRAIIPLLDQLYQLKKAHKEIADAAKSNLVDHQYNEFLQSSSGQWKQFKDNIGQIGSVFAGTLLPAINAVLTPIGKLAGWVAKGIEQYPALGWTIGAAGTAFLTLGTAMAVVTAGQWAWNTAMASSLNMGIVTGIKAVAGVFISILSPMKILTAAQWAWNVALSANPIGLIVAGIAAVAGGAYLIYKNWDTVTEWFNGVLGKIGDLFSWIGDTWNNLFGDEDEKHIKVKPVIEPAKPLAKPILKAAAVGTSLAVAPMSSSQASLAQDVLQPPGHTANIQQAGNNTYHITINTTGNSAGGDEQAIARQIAQIVRREIEQLEQEKAARNRGALHD